MLRKIISVVGLTMLCGCAINQVVKPVASLDGREICIIENRAVRPGFLDAYRSDLANKGYITRLLDRSASVHDCAIVSTYTANWRWDVALYMAYAEIRVYKNGEHVGIATYDSRYGSFNLGKFVNGDQKIAELVDQLFPGRAETHQAGK